MSDTAKKQAISELNHIKKVLQRWDPIGVMPGPKEDDGPIDEYDSYAPGIHTILRGGATVDQVAQHLQHIRTLSMGLPVNRSKDRVFATELVSWWQGR
jgi:hypothetical protein